LEEKSNPCQTSILTVPCLTLGFPASTTMRSTSLLFINFPAYGILLHQHEQTKTESIKEPILGGRSKKKRVYKRGAGSNKKK
jgi:hypothetical protein